MVDWVRLGERGTLAGRKRCMWEWLDELGEWLGPRAGAKERRWLHRKFQLSSPVVEWLGAPERSSEQRLAFAEMLLRLDADPVGNSVAILRPGAPPGMRWAPFDNHRAIFVLDIGRDRVRIALCV